MQFMLLSKEGAMNATAYAPSSTPEPSALAYTTLFELVAAANDIADSEAEALATVVALLRSGRASFVA